jgi:RNA polymerase sigma-70 factor (ECF subfamily)
MGNWLATTQWSQVLAARDGSDTEARRALEGLCQTYWSPLYAYARSLGHDADDAQDLTQGFFAHLLEKEILQRVEPSKGRFRSFLLVSLKNFIAHQHRKEGTLKRGGGTTTIALDIGDVEETLAAPPVQGMTPDQVFEYRWGLTLLERALERLRAEWSETERLQLFEGLLPHLTGQDPRDPMAEIGAGLGMTETATRGAMYRLRQRYGQIVRAEIGETVADAAEIDAEVRHLLAVIKPWGGVRA